MENRADLKKSMMKNIFAALILFVFTLSAHAYEVPEKDWGIALGIRSAKIPFPAKEERVNDMNDWYFGIGIHHRSSIFESSSAFGRIRGGSNYNSLYLQYHF